MRRHAFVDCGSNTCRVLEDRIRSGKEQEFFAFEPQPELRSRAAEVQRLYPDTPIQFFERAVWVHDGVADFYLATRWGPNHRGGSTLLAGHTKNQSAVDYLHPLQVRCVDFSAWLQRTFEPGDIVVVKMDIEGAEYAVLEKMLADGSIDLLSELLVEFHWKMSEEISETRHHTLVTALNERVRVGSWV